MKAAYDEIIATAGKRQHEPQQIVGDLMNAEISEKQARSINYQMTIAMLPLAKEADEFEFEETLVNEALVRDFASGEFLAQQRNAVLIGGRHRASLKGPPDGCPLTRLDWEFAPSEYAVGTVRLIKRTCERHGIFDRLYTDNGSAFAGHLIAGGNVHRFRYGNAKDGVQPMGI